MQFVGVRRIIRPIVYIPVQAHVVAIIVKIKHRGIAETFKQNTGDGGFSAAR